VGKIFALLIAPIVALAGCATHPERGGTNTAVAVVENYLAAINRRDLLALTAYVTADVEWYSVVDGERVLEVTGREALSASLSAFTERHVEARWRIEWAQAIDDYVAIAERSEWREDGRAQSRLTLGVYEMSDGRIRRMTYFLSGASL